MADEQLFSQMKRILLTVEQIPDSCWRDIVSITDIKDYPKNSFFAKADEKPTDLAFVCSGTFRAYYLNADGIEYNKTFFTENVFMIALTSIVTNEVNQINIQALEDSVVLQLNYHKFTELFDEYRELERLVRKVVEFEWAKKEIREIRLVLNNASERYQFFIEEHPGLENKIPQYHIASYLGISPIQLSRIRSNKAGK